MAHNLYCGNGKCSDCGKDCRIDEAIPCSPDCENLTGDGKIKVRECLKSGCDKIRYILDMVGRSDSEILEEYGEITEYPYSL